MIRQRAPRNRGGYHEAGALIVGRGHHATGNHEAGAQTMGRGCRHTTLRASTTHWASTTIVADVCETSLEVFSVITVCGHDIAFAFKKQGS